VIGYFLDLDLVILAEKGEVYEEYARLIRLKYKHVNGEDYRRGRSKVLRGFLERSR
jgi:predicted metal-dependent HD superfamily phosphohydrolase